MRAWPTSAFNLSIYMSHIWFAKATLVGKMKDAHNIHFPGATRRTLRISTSTATSDRPILIRCIERRKKKRYKHQYSHRFY